MEDELLSPCSSFFPVSPPSGQFSPAELELEPEHQFIEFPSCEVPEQWLLGDVVVEAKSEDSGDMWPAGSLLSPESDLSELPPPSLPAPTPRPAPKRRGRKPGPRTEGPTVSHVEAERQRRDKLNRRFCDLRAAVPTVSRMDKASLLADAAAYIAELRARVSQLEEESKQAAAARWETSAVSRGGAASFQRHLAGEEAVEVRMVGQEAAAVRVTMVAASAPHAAAQLMGALCSLELQAHLGSMSHAQGVTVQDVMVDVPAALQRDDGAALRSALLQRLHDGAQLEPASRL